MSQFDKYYFSTGCGSTAYGSTPAWHQNFASMAATIASELAPQRVLDAGCAMGLLVAALRARGIEADGIDISEYAISQVPAEASAYCRLGSITEPFNQHYDLIISIEVLEHMSADQSELAIANFCAYSDSVLFSSTPLDFKEVTHINVRNPEAWSAVFARHGFFRDVDFDASFITPWALRYVRRSAPAARLIRDYERRFWELWKERCDLRALAEEQRHIMASDAETLTELHRRDAEREQDVIAMQSYIQRLEETLQAKNAHIAQLETLLGRIQQGHVLRIIQGLESRLKKNYRP